MHAEYAIRAARAGVHVLCEKPMAVTVEECRQMIAACRKAKVKLMIAYRLHFEGLNLAAIITSFNAADVASYRIVGTKGHLHADALPVC